MITMKFSDMRSKEVISVTDGERLGFVYDMEFDKETGRVNALLIPGAYHFLGMLGKEEDIVIPWEKTGKIGDDLIIVNK